MITFGKILKLLIILFFMSNCSEKISYSGKIINENSINYSKLSNKKEIINQIGQPSYIDPIENKYLYYL